MIDIEASTIDKKLRQYNSSFQMAWQYQLEPSNILSLELGTSPYSYLPFPIVVTHEYESQVAVTDENSEFAQNVNGWIAYIKDQLYSITGVESIYITIDEKQVDIWILIPNRDIGLMRQIVEKEMLIVDNLDTDREPMFEIDFHIVYRYGDMGESKLLPQQAIQIPR